jgi:hypothetical protein
MTSGILAKGAAGLVAALVIIGGGSAVAMAATGSGSPGELAQSVAQLVEGCKDQVRINGTDTDTQGVRAAGNTHGIGHCVSAQVNHNQNGEAHQQAIGARDTDPKPSPSSSSGAHQDHGQGSGSGSTGAPGQGGAGNGNGSGSQGDHGKSGDHGHHPTPTPHS